VLAHFFETGVFVPKKAILALQEGTVFSGISIGADGLSSGEVVFNTAMTGYQEILTDPSYCQQLITLTYPHIGNTGINQEDEEATRIHASGLIIRDLPLLGRRHRRYRYPQADAHAARRRRAVGCDHGR
jgi:carbamoyl-phosphate synthase small subunit